MGSAGDWLTNAGQTVGQGAENVLGDVGHFFSPGTYGQDPGGLARFLGGARDVLAQISPRMEQLRMMRVQEGALRGKTLADQAWQTGAPYDPNVPGLMNLPYQPATQGVRDEDLARYRAWFLQGEFGDPNDPASQQKYDQWVQMIKQTGGHPAQYLNLPPVTETPQLAGSMHTQAQTRTLMTTDELEKQALRQWMQGGGQYPGNIPPTGWTMRAGPLTIVGTAPALPYTPKVPPELPGGPGGKGGGTGGQVRGLPGRDQPAAQGDDLQKMSPHQRVNRQITVADSAGNKTALTFQPDGTTLTDAQGGRYYYDAVTNSVTPLGGGPPQKAGGPPTPGSPGGGTPGQPPDQQPDTTPPPPDKPVTPTPLPNPPAAPASPPQQAGPPLGMPQKPTGPAAAAPPPPPPPGGPTPGQPGAPGAPPAAAPGAPAPGQPAPGLNEDKKNLLRLHPGNQIPGQAPGAGGALDQPGVNVGPPPEGSPAQPSPAFGSASGAFVAPGEGGGGLAGQQLAQSDYGPITPAPVPQGVGPTGIAAGAAPPGQSAPGAKENVQGLGTLCGGAPGPPPPTGGEKPTEPQDPGKVYHDIQRAYTADEGFARYINRKYQLDPASQDRGLGSVDPQTLLRDREAVAFAENWSEANELRIKADQAELTAAEKAEAEKRLAQTAKDALVAHYLTPLGIDQRTGQPITALNASTNSWWWPALSQALHLPEALRPGSPVLGVGGHALQAGPLGQASNQMIQGSGLLSIPIARALGASGRINQTELNRIAEYGLPNIDMNLDANKQKLQGMLNLLDQVIQGHMSIDDVRKKMGLPPNEAPGVPGGQSRALDRYPGELRMVG